LYRFAIIVARAGWGNTRSRYENCEGVWQHAVYGISRCNEGAFALAPTYPWSVTMRKVWIANAVLSVGVWDMSRFIVIAGVHDGA